MVFREAYRLLRRIHFLLDTLWVAASWMLAYWIRFSTGWIPIYYGIPALEGYLAHVPLVLLVWMAVLARGGVYEEDRRWNPRSEWRTLLRCSVEAMIVLICLTYLSTKTEISRLFYLCFWLQTWLGLMGLRALAARLVGGPGGVRRRALIVGRNALAAGFCEEIRRAPEIGLDIAGILVESPGHEAPCRLPVLGTLADIRRVVGREGIDVVVFALPPERAWELAGLQRAVEDLAPDVLVLPDVFPVGPVRPGIEDFHGIPVIQVRTRPQQGIHGIRKRALDVVLSLAALLLLLPLLAVLAAAVKATSPGPVLYRQRRVGLNGRVFDMLKFRTMRVGAEREGGAVWPRRRDPRRTNLGAFLRRYSLDELPQLWNVLKGDMSLVGPRPERPEFIEEFRRKFPDYILRQRVKSGLTGLSQVRGWRGATSLEKRIECDIQYVRGWSMGLDVRILWMTLWRGFVNKAEE